MIKVLSKKEGLEKMFKEEEVYITRDFWHFYKAEECTPDTFKKSCFFVVQTKQDSFQTVNRKDLQMKRITWEELRDVFKNLSLSLPIGENDFLIEDKEEECLDECKFIHSWGLINFTYEQISKYKARNIYKIKIKEEKKKMKKRNLYAALAATTLIFVGCGQQTESTEVTTTPAATSTETTTGAEEEEVSYEFLRYELAADYEGNPAIWIHSRVTNTGSESMLASLIAFPTLFQNGVELEAAIPTFSDTEKAEFQNLSKNIQPGASIEITQLYRLQDNSAITVEVSNLIDWFAEKESFTIELK